MNDEFEQERMDEHRRAGKTLEQEPPGYDRWINVKTCHEGASCSHSASDEHCARFIGPQEPSQMSEAKILALLETLGNATGTEIREVRSEVGELRSNIARLQSENDDIKRDIEALRCHLRDTVKS